jgi:hypothetical protein
MTIGAVQIQASPDTLVNDPAGDAGGSSHTQSGGSIAVNLDTGVICSAYNDSYSGVVLGEGYSGVSRSTNSGMSFQDLGPLSNTSYGYPSMAWRRADGHFYLATLHASGLGLWIAPPNCSGFGFHTMIHVGSGDDKEFIAIDNTPASPHYGRMYAVYTDFNAGGLIYSRFSDDTANWSTPLALSAAGAVQGAWPAVAPNGDVYVAWVRWDSYPAGPINVEVVKSTNGGASFGAVASPMTGKVNPRDSAATATCGRPALNGGIRVTPWPQVAVGPDGAVHVVYSYDPDGYDTGDVIDVFYRRSTNGGASWLPEVRLNDDASTKDQWFPTLSVGATNRVVAAWYDRRDDAGNTNFRYYSRSSSDGGINWEPDIPVSDVMSPVYLDPMIATCFHGDYDHQVQDDGGRVYLQWSDDRNTQDGHADPDVWFEQDPPVLPIFADGFETGSYSGWSNVVP